MWLFLEYPIRINSKLGQSLILGLTQLCLRAQLGLENFNLCVRRSSMTSSRFRAAAPALHNETATIIQGCLLALLQPEITQILEVATPQPKALPTSARRCQ